MRHTNTHIQHENSQIRFSLIYSYISWRISMRSWFLIVGHSNSFLIHLGMTVCMSVSKISQKSCKLRSGFFLLTKLKGFFWRITYSKASVHERHGRRGIMLVRIWLGNLSYRQNIQNDCGAKRVFCLQI